MLETLHLSTSPTTTTPSPLPRPSISRPTHLHFPPSPLPPPLKSPTTPPLDLLLYLDSLGIDSLHCLQTHPPLLTTPLSQLKKTVSFLQSLSLTPSHFRRAFPMCPDLLTSSPTSIIIPATTFLLREAQVPLPHFPHVFHRRPRLLISSVPLRLRPTLYFLQSTIGIDRIGHKHAHLLSSCVESKFVPRMEWMQEMGFSYKETVSMFRRFPSLFCYGVEGNLRPKFEYFVNEMTGRDLKEIVEFPQFFSFSLENRIVVRNRMCVERGVWLSLPTMLKLNDERFQERLELGCSSSAPVRGSPLWWGNSNSSTNMDIDIDTDDVLL